MKEIVGMDDEKYFLINT